MRGLSGFTQAVTNRYEYDAMNRLTLVTNPDTGVGASYTYETGRLASKTYGNGDTVSYLYDVESRLTNLAIKAGAETLQEFAYTYDAMGMMRSANTGNRVIDYGYDAVYQLTSEVVNVDGTITTNAWRYDAAGNLRGTTQGTGQTLLTVNGDNELTSSGDVTNQGVAAVEQVDVAGQVEPGQNSNKWYASTATARGQSAPVGTQDGLFAITNVAVTAGANILTTTVQDVSGNMATQVVNFTVQTVTNRNQFIYDANGNLSSAGVSPVFTYQYDAENRLVRVTSNSVVVLECWYDGSGHRIAKREIIGTQTNAVQYVWDGWKLAAVLGADGQLQEYYTRGVAVTHYTSGIPSATYYLHNNHRGDAVMARQGTNTVATLDYTPYGELRGYSGSYQPRFRFSSKEYDASTGFYHFPYRYYAPVWSRWMSSDPIAGPRGRNLYNYAAQRPTTVRDELGLFGIGDLLPPVFTPPGMAIKGMCSLITGLLTTMEYKPDWVYLHCMASCKISKLCGTDAAIVSGLAKEIIDMWKCIGGGLPTGDWTSDSCKSAFQPVDLGADAKGAFCPPLKSCKEQCKDKVGAPDWPPGPLYGLF